MNKRFVSGLAALAVVFSGALALPAGTFEGFSLTASAATVIDSGKCGENVSWTLDSEGTLTISGTGDMKDDRLPPKLSIWNSYKEKIKKVVIEDGVTSINSDAFDGLEKLTSVTISESVTTIGSSAFGHCVSLTSITIPEGVTTIVGAAFIGCYNLKSITIPESVSYIGGNSFIYTPWLAAKQAEDPFVIVNNILVDGSTAVGDVTIPDSVTSICDWALYNSQNLTGVTIPDSVTRIGDSAFECCPNLKSVTIPDSVTTIETGTFEYCSSLTSITIPDSVTSIGVSAFKDCSSLTSVTIPDSVTSIEAGAFKNCTSLSSVTIPDSVTSIEAATFENCTNLSSVTIPDSVSNFGRGAFRNTAWLDAKREEDPLVIVNNTLIDGYASGGDVTIPDGVTGIGDSAFESCPGLTSVTVPDSVTSIGNCAFGFYFDQGLKKYDDFTIKGHKGTAAEKYADEYGFEFIDLDGNANKYPVVKAEVKGRQFRLKWTAVPDAEKYGLAAYQSGKWRVKVQFAGNVTSYTSPKMKAGTYRMVVCAKINGEWDRSSLSKRAFTVTIA